MNATVEPLPLVPATWMTGGVRVSGWPRSVEQTLHASEREIDQPGVQRREALGDGVVQRQAQAAVGTGVLVSMRHSRASVSRI